MPPLVTLYQKMHCNRREVRGKLSPPATPKSAVTDEKSEANDTAAGDAVTEEKSGEKLSPPATPKSTVTEEKSGEKLSPPATPKSAVTEEKSGRSCLRQSPKTPTVLPRSLWQLHLNPKM